MTWLIYPTTPPSRYRPNIGRACHAAMQAPQADIRELDDAWLIRLDVPGVPRDNVSVTLDDNILTIKGHRELVADADDPHYNRNHFERHFRLPEDGDGNAIEAKVEHGVLQVTIPRAAAAQPRRIVVQH